jgi:hypothetical protein
VLPGGHAQQAFALFMLAQSKGLHPMAALERYHVMAIGGRAQVNMKAAAIQAEFQARGGRIEPTEDPPRDKPRSSAIHFSQNRVSTNTR